MTGRTELISFSVVIPTFNRRERVCQAVGSVLQGRHAARQILVIDDGSDDGTADALAQFASAVEVVRLGTNGGVARARNQGLLRVTSPWIALLDSDDLWLDDHLECLTDHILAHPECRAVQAKERWIRRGNRVEARPWQVPPSGDIFLPSLDLCLVSSSSVALRCDLFGKVGLYDERMPVCEDYDLWLRMALMTPFDLVEQETVVKDGPRPDQLSWKYWGMDRFRVYSLIKLLDQGLPEPLASATRSVTLKKLDILAQGAEKRGLTEAVSAYCAWATAVVVEDHPLRHAVRIPLRSTTPGRSPGRRLSPLAPEPPEPCHCLSADDPILGALLPFPTRECHDPE